MMSSASGPPSRTIRVVTRVAQAAAFVVATVVVSVVATSLWWRLTPSRHLDILVHDQPPPTGAQGSATMLGQLLEHHRVQRNEETASWPSSRPDLIVLGDVSTGHSPGDGADLLTDERAAEIARWVDEGTPAYAEFALVNEPTPFTAGETLERVFGFRSTVWSGIAVENLAEVSTTIRSLGPSPWPYDGPGLILVATPVPRRPDADRKVVVLTLDQLEQPLPLVIGGPPGSIPGESTFDRWFGVVEAAQGTTVDAWIELPVNTAGAETLDRVGIPRRFPALIRTERTLYFAGDGLTDDTPFRLRRLHGGALFSRLVTGSEFRLAYQILEPSVGWLLDQLSTPPAATDPPPGG